MDYMSNRVSIILLAIGLGILTGCTNSSTESSSVPISQLNFPVITNIYPDSITIGDTLIITGSNFGAQHGISEVRIGNANALIVLFWSDTLVRVIVPDSAKTGNVIIAVEGRTSNNVSIIVTQPPVQLSFLRDVRPIFLIKNCINCHGGGVGLYVGTVAQLLQGGTSGPAIVPGSADSSLLIQKLSPNPPFGERMPQYGPYLPDSLDLIIKTWINQGAKDN